MDLLDRWGRPMLPYLRREWVPPSVKYCQSVLSVRVREYRFHHIVQKTLLHPKLSVRYAYVEMDLVVFLAHYVEDRRASRTCDRNWKAGDLAGT